VRAVSFEYLGLELAAAHGPDLGLFVGDLQRAEGVVAQGFELGSGCGPKLTACCGSVIPRASRYAAAPARRA
jgi:hypothetical protein